MSQPCSATSRPYNRWLFLGLPIGLGLLMLLPAFTRLDFALAELFYVPGDGFIGRHSAFIEDWLHDRAKQLVIVLGVLVIAGFIGSLCLQRLTPWRRTLGYLVLAMALSTSFVNPLKTLTRMHCPWSLSEFGGVEQFSELLGPRAPAVEKGGRCWPGGHAAAGFTLFAFFFVWRDRQPRRARAALVSALLLGGVFSLSRMIQGAHFLSHNLWTALFCWLICLGCYHLLLYRSASARGLSPTISLSPSQAELPDRPT